MQPWAMEDTLILKLGGDVMGLDVNSYSLERAVARLSSEKLKGTFTPVQGNFKDIEDLAKKNGFGQVHGILYDLGYSSSQLDEDPLGLTFLKDEPLDMRLDPTLGVTAADLVNTLTERDLARLIFEYSDERMARRFARAIIKARSLKKIQTTAQLAAILADEASPGYEHGRINPATRTFQALRIAVNDEIRNLELSLPRAARLLLPVSRMIVISFHSLEDKVAKQFGRNAQPTIRPVYKKALEPTDAEVSSNPRARSAKMRVFEKNDE
jgi:16S rRNA (cytosine1402-N4)-methyltransferase